MPADMFAVAVDWYGPFRSLSHFRQLATQHRVGECLYLGYEISGGRRSYVGITKSVVGRMQSSHHVLGEWQSGTFELWLGIVSSQSEPGRKPNGSPRYHSTALNFAEHLVARYVGTSQNQRKLISAPKRSGFLFNRWFKLEPGWPRWENPPHKNWPDLIEYEEDGDFARSVFFNGRVEEH